MVRRKNKEGGGGVGSTRAAEESGILNGQGAPVVKVECQGPADKQEKDGGGVAGNGEQKAADR